MTQVPMLHNWRWQLFFAVISAVVVPLGTTAMNWTSSLKEALFVSVASWLVGMISQIAYSLHSFHVDRLENKHFLDVINEGDCLLLELQSRFRDLASRKLSGKPNRVFIDYCHRSLKNSLSVARLAAQNGELEVHDHHFETIGTVLEAFEGCKDRTFRCVWLIEKDEALFDKYWREYMKSIVQLSQRKRQNEQVQVRILFVLEDQEQLKRVPVKTVLGFVATKKGFKFSLMLQKDYKSRLIDGNQDMQYLDFGIYGDHLLFRTKSYSPNIGVFSDNQTLIETYRSLHNAAMDAAETLSIPTGLPTEVSQDQFLLCDKEEEQ